MKRSLLLLAIPFALAAVPTAAAAAQNEAQAGLCEPGHGEHTSSRHAHESTPAGKLASSRRSLVRSKLQSFAREQRTPCEHGDKCLDKHGACKDCPKQDHAQCTDCDEDCGGRG